MNKYILARFFILEIDAFGDAWVVQSGKSLPWA